MTTTTNRKNTTKTLTALAIKRLKSRKFFYAREVSFDKGTPQERRIDIIGFKPFTPNYAVEPTSVEIGNFECYEIKGCMSDLTSGNGLTFYGDHNYLVCPMELYRQIKAQRMDIPGINSILCPGRSGACLLPHPPVGFSPEKQSYRKRPASEMLWQMIKARNWWDE